MVRSAVLILAGALASGGAVAQSLPEMERQTAAIAERYLAVWSSSAWASIEGVPYVYGPTVRFYGRPYTQRMLEDEKIRAVRRWPVRSYVHRPGTLAVTCNEDARRCVARSIMDYRVSNPARGTSARGTARFDLGVSFEGARPRILWEGGGRLGRRDAG
ncbi:MAG: hypothetical protein JO048_14860 [Methylobacteriaceae bacterium]|nr:hypothetical protein [Methylobacteriaceae bacterium]